jgi:hypothetical protein
MLAAGQAVNDVPAIKLPQRKQVQRRGKKSHPRRAPNRVDQQPRGIDVGMKQFDKESHQWRLAENDRRGALHSWNNSGSRDGKRHHRRSDHKSRHRPRQSNVKQRPASGDRRTNANECAKSAKQSGRRNEIRIAHVDAIKFAGVIMPQLVRQQNSKQGKRKRNAKEQQLRVPEGQDHRGKWIAATREWLAVPGIGRRELRAYSQRGEKRESEQQQGGPKRSLRRLQRLNCLRHRAEIYIQDIEGRSAVTITSNGVKGHAVWMHHRV